MIVGILCRDHGYFPDHQDCPVCNINKNPGIGIIDHVDPKWCHGWYEHIDINPIYIESKKHLLHECEKRDLYPRAFIKHRSRHGKGLTIRR